MSKIIYIQNGNRMFGYGKLYTKCYIFSGKKTHKKKKKEQRRKWHGDNLATEERFVIGNGQQIIR